MSDSRRIDSALSRVLVAPSCPSEEREMPSACSNCRVFWGWATVVR